MRCGRWAAAVLAVALDAGAQVVPAANYTDLWWNPSESGWGVSIVQHASNKMFAVWFTYDPREPATASAEAAGFKPLWIAFPDSTWVTPTRATGPAYVTRGAPYFEAGDPAGARLQLVGTFTFDFADASNGTFTYDINPPAGLASDNPAFGLAAFSGSRPIRRQAY